MELPKRKNHRLKNYDYGQRGYYYITICTLDKKNVLCEIKPVDLVNDHKVVDVIVSDMGKAVRESFYKIEEMNENVKIDKFVLMPNHIHAIVVIENEGKIEEFEKKYDFEIRERRGRRSLQGVVKDFKSVTTRIYKKEAGSKTSLWQESFYDEVIRDDEHYYNVSKYIEENPIKWKIDCYHSNP